MVPVNHHYFIKFVILIVIIWLGSKAVPFFKGIGNKVSQLKTREYTPPKTTDYPFQGAAQQKKEKPPVTPESFYKDLPRQ